MKHIQTQTEWEEEMGNKIIQYLRGEIYIDLPFFDTALSALEPVADPSAFSFATEGICLYYSPESVMELFKTNELFLKRAFLHTVFHCLYAHLWIGGNRDRRIWNLSCDIFTEYLIDQLKKTCTRRILSLARQQIYETMEKQRVTSAAEIYQFLFREYKGDGQGVLDEEKICYLEKEFYTDDHTLWPDTSDEKQNKVIQKQEAENRWKQIARQTAIKQEKSGKDPDEGERMLLTRLEAEKGKRNYGEFLQKFAVKREVLHCDPDEFELGYYTFGLRHYGNLPLIEPLETKEEKRIEEFVIVLDTSYSTNGELVKGFLRETFDILMQENAFFGTSRLHILQCDDGVRSHIEITRREQIEPILRCFEMKGGGNTDFRPAFTYVNQLLDEGKIKKLGGLLYFTDGRGIYPAKKPEYDTAFLFLGDYEQEKVPAWAMRIRLDQEEQL